MKTMIHRATISLFVLMVGVSLAADPVPTATPPAQKVVLQFEGHKLVGFLYQPEGAGPWPALIWNHGSEKDPGAGRQFPAVRQID